MYRPECLIIENLLTHSNTKFNFVPGRTIMIKGVNNYDEEPKSNGAGKSALLEGVSIAMTGEWIRNVSTPDIIKDGEDSASVYIKLVNESIHSTLEIKRTLYRGKNKSSSLEILENGELLKFAHVRDGDALILNKIGISKEDLYNYYIISKSKYKSFFYSSDGDKRKLISRFSNADIVDSVFDEIENDAKLCEDGLNELEASKNVLLGKIAAYEEGVAEENSEDSKKDLIKSIEDSIVQKQEVINGLEEKIDTGNYIIADYEAVISNINKEILGIESWLKKNKPKDLSNKKDEFLNKISALNEDKKALNVDLKDADGLLTGFRAELSSYNKLLSDIEKDIAGLISCPKCSHEFSVKDSECNVAELKDKHETLVQNISEQNELIQETEDVIEGFRNKISLINTQIGQHNQAIFDLDTEETKFNSEINANKRKLSNLQTSKSQKEGGIESKRNTIITHKHSIELANTSIAEMRNEIVEIQSRNAESAILDLKNKIVEANKELEELDVLILAKREEATSKRKWLEIFKRFNIKLSNMAIKSIEALTNDIQKRMNSNLSIVVDGYKVNRDGSVSDRITPSVMRYGVNEGSFFRFSEGEKGRLNISATLGMQELINMNCPSGGLDMTFIDEITESLDSSGIANVVQSLDMLGKTIAIITHASDEQVMIPNEVTVVKTAKGSKLI